MIRAKSGIFARLLLSFALFALGLALVMGIAAYFTASSLSRDFLARRAGMVLETLMEAERQARSGNEAPIDARQMVSRMRMDFLVGKQVPRQWAGLPPGLHFPENSGQFVLLERKDGIAYVLCGPASLEEIILAGIGSMFLWCGAIGLAAAMILAFLLAGRLARPLQQLSGALGERDIAKALPALMARGDELGALARAMRAYHDKNVAALAREKFFAGAASHELRTPLAVLGGGLEILESQCRGNAGQEALLRRLERTVGDMNLVVSALLHLARGERQPLTQICLESCLRQVLASFALELPPGQDLPAVVRAASGVNIRIAGRTGQLRGHEDLARIALRNLIENACRHGGGEEVFIELLPGSVTIRNFSAPAGASGSGFGLSIAQRACDRMAWRLSRSRQGNETVCRLDFQDAGDGDPA